MSDRGFSFSKTTVGRQCTDSDIFLSRVKIENHVQRSEHYHKRRAIFLLGKGLDCLEQTFLNMNWVTGTSNANFRTRVIFSLKFQWRRRIATELFSDFQ